MLAIGVHSRVSTSISLPLITVLTGKYEHEPDLSSDRSAARIWAGNIPAQPAIYTWAGNFPARQYVTH